MQKPVILIIDKHRARSPLLSQYYNYISRPDGPLNIIIDDRVDVPAETIIKERLGKIKPDYIYWGFTIGTSIMKSYDYINSNNIKIILDIGDIEEFTADSKIVSQNFEKCKISFIIARWKRLDNYHSSYKLNRYIMKKEWLRDVKIIHVPWGINPDTYQDRKLKRDIDASLICTIYRNTHHRNRRIIKNILCNMDDKINIKIDNIWGDEYINTLFRSKIFIVDGSKRDFMVQKYIEGPACGAMLLGEIPSTAKDIFVDKISIAEVKDYSKIDKQIMYYLEHDNEREKIAKEGRRRIFEVCTLEKVVKGFENAILADWKS